MSLPAVPTPPTPPPSPPSSVRRLATAKFKRRIFFARIYLLIISCAGFHTMIVFSVITDFADIDSIIRRIRGGTCYIGLSIYLLIAFPKKLEKVL
ncbi:MULTISPECIES: hypothetical protein [unclassified Pseudomonas]|jgi:hypothetical protein|uniref:hypothetical protein n=1 Tax=unclassified Pseudomonas TaxID=196821 RepID=UPI0011A261E3|nr:MULTISPECIES: hypothetical protein [unclassified Pseudomonas]